MGAVALRLADRETSSAARSEGRGKAKSEAIEVLFMMFSGSESRLVTFPSPTVPGVLTSAMNCSFRVTYANPPR